MLTLADARASTAATITIKDAASLAGVDPRTLGSALEIHGGEIPARRIGRRVVIPRETFLRWLEGEPRPVPADPAPTAPDTTAIVRATLRELLSSLDAGTD